MLRALVLGHSVALTTLFHALPRVSVYRSAVLIIFYICCEMKILWLVEIVMMSMPLIVGQSMLSFGQYEKKMKSSKALRSLSGHASIIFSPYEVPHQETVRHCQLILGLISGGYYSYQES